MRRPGLLVQVQAGPPQEGRSHRGQLRRQGGARQERHAVLKMEVFLGLGMKVAEFLVPNTG